MREIAIFAILLIAVFIAFSGLSRITPPQSVLRAMHPAGVSGCQSRLLLPAWRDQCFRDELTQKLGNASNAQASEEVEELAGKLPHLNANCHRYMHEVAGDVVRMRKLSLADLDQLVTPAGNINCAAGLLHGALIELIDGETTPAEAKKVAVICSDQPNRIMRLNCTHGLGHVFMRASDVRVDPAVRLCEALGPQNGPDCAPGIFHEYFFGVRGMVGAKKPPNAISSPQRLCATVPDDFALACWIRALQNKYPDGMGKLTFAKLEPCRRLSPAQRAACVGGHASAVMDFSDRGLRRLVEFCAKLPSPADVPACLTTTTTLGGTHGISHCAKINSAQARADCLEILGQRYAVYTGIEQVERSCARLDRAEDQKSCRLGASRIEAPLGAM